MRDFTIRTYSSLLKSLKTAGYSFQTFEQFLPNPIEKVIILRHDVDRLPYNSLVSAKIEHGLGIEGSYYFRIGKESNNRDIIRKIVELGHEIGYHYETMDTASRKTKEKSEKTKDKGEVQHSETQPSTLSAEQFIDAAYEEFYDNLEYFRTLYPVKTICMHGSPLSKYDNRDIWKKYDYKKLGLIGEPYFDINFSKVLYLTDTGRRWNGDKVSVRDRVSHKIQNSEPRTYNSQLSTVNYSFRHTKDIIKAAEEGVLPKQIMITIHPQRWNDSIIPWTKELVMQNIKNLVKRNLIKIRREK